eukprot:359132-Chlamydomonas_euryale.AAC.4
MLQDHSQPVVSKLSVHAHPECPPRRHSPMHAPDGPYHSPSVARHAVHEQNCQTMLAHCHVCLSPLRASQPHMKPRGLTRHKIRAPLAHRALGRRDGTASPSRPRRAILWLRLFRARGKACVD